MPILGLDSGRATPELKLRLKFYGSWTWIFFIFAFVFCFCCCCCFGIGLVCLFVCFGFDFGFLGVFVCLFCYCGFPILFPFLLSFFIFLYCKFYYHFLIPTPTPSLSLLFSFPTTRSAPSHPLSPPALTFPSHSPPTCHQTTHTHHPLTNLHTNFTQPQTLAIPDPSTLHYNNRNTPNTHKEHKTQQSPHSFSHSPIPLPASPFSVTLSNSPNFYS
jgi:hypothetical protein